MASKKAKKNSGYDWSYSSFGGVVRVNVRNGEDIAHLGELDQKLWTVLSCPVKGLEFDEKTLQMLDTDYRVAEVQPVDMFPHTPHVENVVLLIKR